MKATHYATNTQYVHSEIICQYLAFFGRRSIAKASHSEIRHFVARVSEDGATFASVYPGIGVPRQPFVILKISRGGPRFLLIKTLIAS